MAGKSQPLDLTKTDVPAEPAISEPVFAVWGEAPGTEEMRERKPLCGPSGKLFNKTLFSLDVRRRYVHIDNFCQTQLPRNDTDKLWKITSTGRFKTHPDFEQLVERMKDNIRQVEAKLIVLLGATPLVGLFGPGYASIDAYRGYQMEWEDKVVMPTIHPARCLVGRSPAYRWILYADIYKGMRIAKHGRAQAPVKVYVPGRGWQEYDL